MATLELLQSFRAVCYELRHSTDPLKDKHCYCRLVPRKEVLQFTVANIAKLKDLNLDYVTVDERGIIVHFHPHKMELVAAVAAELLLDADEGWISHFEHSDVASKIDEGWLDYDTVEAYIEMRPFVSEADANLVSDWINKILQHCHPVQYSHNPRIIKVGNDFSGRLWIRGFFPAKVLKIIVNYSCVESIHPPLYSTVMEAPPVVLSKCDSENFLQILEDNSEPNEALQKAKRNYQDILNEKEKNSPK